MDNIGCIIQARMGSKRLPGKSMMLLGGEPLLGCVLTRAEEMAGSWPVIIATSMEKEDDVIAAYGDGRGVPVFRGSLGNVLERYYLAAKQFGFTGIIRVTADNPFLDAAEGRRLLDAFIKEKPDYAHNFSSEGHGLPTGTSIEIFSMGALTVSYLKGKMPHHIEHVNEYILENTGMFKILMMKCLPENNFPGLRLTVDTPADFEFARKIVNQFRYPSRNIPLSRIIEWCKTLPK